MRRLFIANSEKDQHLILHAINSSDVFPFNLDIVYLETGQDLADKTCQIIIESFHEAKKLGAVSSHYQEIRMGEYRSIVSSLVLKWGYQQVGILEMWSELGTKLARSQCFTNGNKRTALIAVRNFIYACGFGLKDTGFPTSWEKLLMDVTVAEKEERAKELIKEKILREIII